VDLKTKRAVRAAAAAAGVAVEDGDEDEDEEEDEYEEEGMTKRAKSIIIPSSATLGGRTTSRGGKKGAGIEELT
jgi:hypothetical protein